MKVLVTGSSGLIGKALCGRLLEAGHEVVRFDLRDREAGYNVLSPSEVASQVEGVDGIFHLAAVSRVIWGEKDPGQCWRTNVGGLANVISAAKSQKKVPWLVFASSREVYGEPTTFPVVETSPLVPVNVYGYAKVEGERLISVAREAGMKASTVRLANVFGSVEDWPDRVIPAFARAAAEGRELRVDGSNHTFDFTHTSDVSRGLASLAELMSSKEPAPPPIHFVGGKATTLGELASWAVKLGASGVREAPERAYDVGKFFGSYERARSILGWEPKANIEAMFAKLVEDFKAQ